MHIPSHNYRKQRFEKECRLCYYESFARRGAEYLGSFAKSAIDFGFDTTSDVYQGIKYAWERDTRSEQMKRQSIASLAEFQRSMPKSISDLITKALSEGTPSLLELDAMVDYQAWIAAFADTTIFDETAHPIQSLTAKNGVEGVLLSVGAQQRKILMYEFGQEVISRAVRNEPDVQPIYDSVFAGPDAIAGTQHTTAIHTLRAMYGIEDPAAGSDEEKLAHAALRHRYWKDGITTSASGERYRVADPNAADSPSGVVDVNGTTETLFEEVRRRKQVMRNITNVAQLQRALPPSLLKGAMQMSIVSDSECADLDTFLNVREKEELETRLKTQRDLLKHTNVVESNLSSEAEGFTDVFMNMGGVEKCAFIAFAAYLLSKAPKLGMSLGGLYFMQKFFLKIDNPIDQVWSPVISGVTKQITDLASPALEAINIKSPDNPASIEEMQQVADIMSRYVSLNVRKNVETAATGFGLLADMELSDLARYLRLGDTGRAVLDGANPELQELIKSHMEHKHLDPYQTKTFFSRINKDINQNIDVMGDASLSREFGSTVNRHLADAGDALAVVYYTIGLESVGTGNRAAKVVEFARQRTAGGRYDLLPENMEYEGSMENPREEFLQIVRIGMANPQPKTLGAFVQEHMGITTRTPQEIAEEQNRMFIKHAELLERYEHDGAKFGLKARREGTAVMIGFNGNQDYDLSVTLDEFTASTFNEDKLTERWIQHVKNVVEFDGSVPSPSSATYGEMTLTFEPGGVVRITIGPGLDARTTIEKFGATPKAELYTKMETWQNNGHLPANDPL